jgi:hypothetical protein
MMAATSYPVAVMKVMCGSVVESNMRHAREDVKNYFQPHVTFFLLTPGPGSGLMRGSTEVHMKASARSNAPWGYKALVVYPSHTHVPVRHNFKTREEAIAYAERYIETNRKAKAARDADYAARHGRV